MSVSDMFSGFLDNLIVDNYEQISLRYGEITASINKKFRDTESKTANSLQVGSYGRWTGIKGISDLDMLYIMPKNAWDEYKDGGQYTLLSDTRDAIKARYPNTDVRVDRLVVTVRYTNFHVEVQPVFEEYDENDESYFKYPDTYDGGKWKITKPRQEIAAMKDFVDQKNKNLRRLCKMVRAWKNKHGVVMGGLLIDTLAYNYLSSTSDYDNKSYTYYDWMSRDFFKYLMDQPEQDYYKALGSRQNVKVKKKFQKKAKEAYELCLEAIDAGGSASACSTWKDVYGKHFPDISDEISKDERGFAWRNTEEFIEDKYDLDIQYHLRIDCDVKQNGFREYGLRDMLRNKFRLLPNKRLVFKVIENEVPFPYILKWKVLNRGEVAQKKDQIRGQIINGSGNNEHIEHTSFKGGHIVECYAVKGTVVVARDRIDVPIASGE